MLHAPGHFAHGKRSQRVAQWPARGQDAAAPTRIDRHWAFSGHPDHTGGVIKQAQQDEYCFEKPSLATRNGSSAAASRSMRARRLGMTPIRSVAGFALAVPVLGSESRLRTLSGV